MELILSQFTEVQYITFQTGRKVKQYRNFILMYASQKWLHFG